MPRDTIQANKADRNTLRLRAQETPLQFSEQGEAKLPTVQMVAYTGAAMRFWAYEYPVVVDLAGMRAVGKSRPLLKDHNPGSVVGHSTRVQVEAGKTLVVEGVLSGGNAATAEVIASAKNGFPWQASIGAPVQRMELVRAGNTVKVNGRTFQGPIYVAREWTLSEISVVALGADDNTESRIAARQQGGDMDFEAWLRANHWDPDQLSDSQRKTLEAAWKAETNKPEPKKDEPGDEGVKILRAKAAEENKRIADVSEIAADYPSIRAKAIEEGWDATKTELEVMRAKAPTINGIVRPSRDSGAVLNRDAIEAGLMCAMGVAEDDRKRLFNERQLEAGRPFERMGLKDLVMVCGRLDKHDLPQVFGDGSEAIRAAFSTLSLPAILENVIGKQALLSYRASDIQALRLCRIGSTPDFKKVSRVRMLGTGRFERVGKAGDLPSGTLSDQKYENQADTYGQVLKIDRQTILNDDLQVLADAGMEIGNTGAEVINHLFAEKILNPGGGYFTTGPGGNTITGSPASVFGETGLENALTTFRKKKAGPGDKAKDKRPINIAPEILLVPPELEVKAQILTGSSDIRPGGGGDRGNFNPWRGRYEVISMPHISDNYYTGYSLTAWYLMANPTRVPAFELLFVNNRREPTVERFVLPGEQLGIGIRGYLDVGCEAMDPNGIVKAAGA